MKKFLRAAAIRAVRTVVQAAVAVIGTSAVLTEVDWLAVASSALLAGVMSMLTCIATGLPEVEDDD